MKAYGILETCGGKIIQGKDQIEKNFFLNYTLKFM